MFDISFKSFKEDNMNNKYVLFVKWKQKCPFLWKKEEKEFFSLAFSDVSRFTLHSAKG